jgi:hypothetical protein
MADGVAGSRRIARRVTATGLCLLAVAFLFAALAGTAEASEEIESFTTSASDTQAGGHPDLTTSFTLANPGHPEAAENVIFNAPQGVFGNPYAITHCTSSDFALDQCPSNAQAGTITIYADYKGESDKLMGTAPIFDLEPQSDQTALFAFVVPTLDIPIDIPVAVRTAGDYGLRFTVQDITQGTPLEGARLTFWGFPALNGPGGHEEERFAKGNPGEPANCPGLADTSCLGRPVPASIAVHPLTDNPTTCTGKPLTTTLEVQTYQDPTHLSRAVSEYPETTSCDLEVFNPVLYASPTTTEGDAPSGLNIKLSAPQFLGFAASPSELKSATVTLRPVEGRDLHHRHPGAQRPARRSGLHRRTEAGQPVQTVHDRLGLRDQREAGRLLPARPPHGTGDGVLRRPSPGAL